MGRKVTMPNRILKESITTSTSLANLTAEEERHFYRLLVQADDYGCFQAHPSIIRAKGYALLIDQVSTLQSQNWTKALVRQNIIHLYESEGNLYGHFVTWEKHQQVRAKRRRYPVPACDITCNQMISDAYYSYRNPIQSESLSEEPPIFPLKQGDSGGESISPPSPPAKKKAQNPSSFYLRETSRPLGSFLRG